MTQLNHGLGSLKTVFKNILLHPDYGMRPTDDDFCIPVTGKTGTGKSTLVLHLFEYWYKELLELKLDDELFEMFASNIKEFVRAIHHSEKDYFIPHDEAIKDLHRKKSTTKKSIDLYQAFNVIRGKRLCVPLIIPSLLDLDKDFVKNRVKCLLHVFKRKNKRFVAVFSKERTDLLIPELLYMSERFGKSMKARDRPDPMKCKVKPNLVCEFGKYSGVYVDAYKLKKNHNMDSTVEDLLKEHGYDKDDKKLLKRKHQSEIVKMRDELKMSFQDIALHVGLHYNTVSRKYREMKEGKGKW